MYNITVRSRQREEMIEFTDEVRRHLRESGAREGICVLYVRHSHVSTNLPATDQRKE